MGCPAPMGSAFLGGKCRESWNSTLFSKKGWRETPFLLPNKSSALRKQSQSSLNPLYPLGKTSSAFNCPTVFLMLDLKQAVMGHCIPRRGLSVLLAPPSFLTQSLKEPRWRGDQVQVRWEKKTHFLGLGLSGAICCSVRISLCMDCHVTAPS